MPTFLLSLMTGWQRYLIITAVLAIVILGIHVQGVHQGREEILRENTVNAVKIVEKQGAVTQEVITKYVKVAAAAQVVHDTIDREVVRYETAKLDQCPLSNGFVSLHDAAAANTVPDAAKSVDGTASGIAAAAATGTITKNYASCWETINRLKGLQDWVTQQSK